MHASIAPDRRRLRPGQGEKQRDCGSHRANEGKKSVKHPDRNLRGRSPPHRGRPKSREPRAAARDTWSTSPEGRSRSLVDTTRPGTRSCTSRVRARECLPVCFRIRRARSVRAARDRGTRSSIGRRSWCRRSPACSSSHPACNPRCRRNTVPPFRRARRTRRGRSTSRIESPRSSTRSRDRKHRHHTGPSRASVRTCRHHSLCPTPRSTLHPSTIRRSKPHRSMRRPSKTRRSKPHRSMRRPSTIRRFPWSIQIRSSKRLV